GAFDQELRAVAPPALRKIERDLRRGHGGRLLDVGEGGERSVGLLEGLEHPLEDQLEAEAAGVDDAGIPQNLELAWRLQHRGASARRGGGRSRRGRSESTRLNSSH